MMDIVVLDFSNGEVYIYHISHEMSYDEIDKFLFEEQKLNINNIQYMFKEKIEINEYNY